MLNQYTVIWYNEHGSVDNEVFLNDYMTAKAHARKMSREFGEAYVTNRENEVLVHYVAGKLKS